LLDLVFHIHAAL